VANTIQITTAEKYIKVLSPFAYKDRLKAIGGRWNPAGRNWLFPRTHGMAAKIYKMFYTADFYTTPKIDYKADDEFRWLVASGKPDDADEFKTRVDLPDPPSKTTAWDHQRQAYWYAASMPSTMLAMDMGTGKSKVAVDVVSNMDSRLTLILCPKSVINVWPREFAAHSDKPFDIFRATQASGVKKEKAAREAMTLAHVKKRPFVCVINHEASWREPFDKFIHETEWHCIIVDESHRAKAPKGKFATFLASLAHKPARKLMLTGTPMPHSPLDIFAQYKFLEPAIFGTSYFRFKTHYGIMGGFQNKAVVGFQHQDELHDKLYSIAYRVTKEEALDLPEEIDTRRDCPMDAAALKLYADIESDFYAQVGTGEVTASNALSQMLHLQRITSGWLTTDDGVLTKVSDHKRLEFDAILDDLPEKEPLVVFARFRADLDDIRKTAVDRGLAYGEVSGRQNDLTDRAEYPEDVDVMGVQIQAGGVGVDLTRASYAVYYSCGFSLGDYLQSRSRLHRPGQVNKVTFIHLTTPGTIDPMIYAALRRRRNLVEAVLKKELPDDS